MDREKTSIIMAILNENPEFYLDEICLCIFQANQDSSSSIHRLAQTDEVRLCFNLYG
jgi:hypothetical protein